MSAKFGIPFGYNAKTAKFHRYIEPRHLLAFGPTRSGKGATVICPALLRGVPHSVLLIDPKGQNAAVTARRRRELGQDVHLLNPFNELGLGTSRLNPLAPLRIEQPNVVADVRSLAEALIISEEGSGRHWSDSALDLVTALLLYLIARRPRVATLADMRELLTLPQSMFQETIAQMVGMREYPFICQPAARFASSTAEIASVLSTATTQTFFLDDPNIAHVLGADGFSLGQLKERPTTVYVILPGRYIDAYARFFRLLVTSALDQLTAKPGGHRTLFILDEFASLQNLGAVSRAFGFAAGYNVQVWPFLQDLPQLQAIYGKRWESFVANAGLLQFFTAADMTTAEYIERRGGKKTMPRETVTHREISIKESEGGFSGVTTSFSSEQVSLLPPTFTMGLDFQQQIVFSSGQHGPEFFGRQNYWEIPELAGTFDPDPFHL